MHQKQIFKDNFMMNVYHVTLIKSKPFLAASPAIGKVQLASRMRLCSIIMAALNSSYIS